MGRAPTGTVTFLFTDIVGSTRHWQEDRSGMERSLAVHDALLRRTIEEEDGYVFSTGGDSFAAAFPTPIRALNAAISAQLALEQQNWEGPALAVRIGVHTGNAEERDGNYYGPHVGRCARIMSLGGPAQTLVSGVTADLAVDDLGEDLTLVDLGTRRLSGIDRPERIFELAHPHLPGTGLAEESESGRVNLPEALTSFVGRHAELSAIADQLESSRLLTLTGPGGTGKTRLASEAARATADRYRDGVWMSELGPVGADEVLTQIAGSWNLRPGEGADLDHVVSSYLSNRQLLLVLDNCEHVLEPVTAWLASVLPTCPELSVLATSRESLGVAGEAVFSVPPLGLPVGNDPEDSEAVLLFLDRIGSVRPGYQPTDADLEAIVMICRRLDGIPLGLELAAARLRSMGPIDLEAHLEDSFRVLSGAAKGALPRQRTLEATIDWSYQTLDQSEAALFRTASVFSGGFDLQGIEAVGRSQGLDVWEIANLVDQLHDKSLLTTVAGSSYRFRMLEPIRAFAAEQLAAHGETQARKTAHAGYFRSFVSDQSVRLRSHEQRAAEAALSADLDNVRAALRFLRDTGSFEEMLRMCFDLVFYWAQASLQVEALDLLVPVLEANPDIDPSVLAKAWWTASTLAFNLTDPRSADYAEQAIRFAEAGGKTTDIGWANLGAALAIYGTTRRTDAADFLSRGMELVGTEPEEAWWSPAWDPVYRDFAAIFVDPNGAGVPSRGSVVARAKALGDEFIAAMGLITVYQGPGSVDATGEQDLEEAVRILDDLGFRHALGHALIYWGAATTGDTDNDEAGEKAVARGASILAEVGDVPCAIEASADVIAYLSEHGEVEKAREHLVFATRQAHSDPERFQRTTARMAQRVMAASGDTGSADRMNTYLDDGQDANGLEVLADIDNWLKRGVSDRTS